MLSNFPKKGGGGGYSEKFWRGCVARVFATILLATDTGDEKHNLGYGKWVKLKPLTIGNITKLTTFEAILHEIGQIWHKSFCFEKKWWN